LKEDTLRKKYFGFFILFLAAVVIAGFTMGIIINYKNLSQQALAKSIPVAAQPSTAVSSDPTSVISGNGELMVMSQAEKGEIELMLNTVGISADKEYNQRINEFQEKNTITPTGILDSWTLGTLINQVKMYHINQHLKR
jgi:archaellum component FlaG (FlaF/FlaG flagellin family)